MEKKYLVQREHKPLESLENIIGFNPLTEDGFETPRVGDTLMSISGILYVVNHVHVDYGLQVTTYINLKEIYTSLDYHINNK